MIASQLSAVTSPLCARVNATIRTLRNPLRAAVASKTHRPGFAHQRPTGPILTRAMSSGGVTPDAIEAKNAENAVIVYSKTYCPYCSAVKSLLSDLKVPAKIVELDELADGDAVQAALGQVSGMRTVPQVFVGGKLVGGCDDTMAAHKSGQLKTALAGVGIAI